MKAELPILVTEEGMVVDATKQCDKRRTSKGRRRAPFGNALGCLRDFTIGHHICVSCIASGLCIALFLHSRLRLAMFMRSFPHSYTRLYRVTLRTSYRSGSCHMVEVALLIARNDAQAIHLASSLATLSQPLRDPFGAYRVHVLIFMGPRVPPQEVPTLPTAAVLEKPSA